MTDNTPPCTTPTTDTTPTILADLTAIARHATRARDLAQSVETARNAYDDACRARDDTVTQLAIAVISAMEAQLALAGVTVHLREHAMTTLVKRAIEMAL